MENKSSRAKIFKEVVKTYTYVLIWMTISCSVILFNKWLLAYSGFPFPITLTLWHMAFCSAIAFVCVRVLKITPSLNMPIKEWYTRVLPIGLLYAGSLWLSNSAYLYLSVSFIQMTKSLMPGLVFASGVLVGTEKYSLAITADMLLIAFGVLVCAFGEMNLVVGGLITQLAALAFEALRLTLVQVLINARGMSMNPIQSLYYVSPACFLCLLIPFVSVEWHQMSINTNWDFNPAVMLANAMTAFILNLAVFMLIGKTSALTMNIAGVIKDWMLIFFSFSLFHAPVTRLNLLGYVFCCSGVFIYQWIKLQALKAKVVKDTKAQKEDSEHTPLLDSDTSTRSNKDVLAEIRRLQDEMKRLEARVHTSQQLVNGPTTGAEEVSISIPEPPKEAKDT